MARFILVDANLYGREGENNDCTVRALALACNFTYAQAHSVMARAGRKSKRGWWVHTAFFVKSKPWKHKTVRGVAMVKHTRYTRKAKLTIGRFLDKHRTGRFVISTARHAIAVIDGACHDTSDHLCKERLLVRSVVELRVPKRRGARKAKVAAPFEGPGPMPVVQMQLAL